MTKKWFNEHEKGIAKGAMIFAVGMIIGFRICAKMSYYVVPPVRINYI